MRIALCQLNLAVGDLAGNKQKILDSLKAVSAEGAEMALFPELAVTSYPPEDLLLKPGFIEENLAVLQEIAAETGPCTALVGFAMAGAVDLRLAEVKSEKEKSHESEEARWPGLYNAVAVLRDGAVQTQVLKSHLPNYAVFDEHRYFAEGVPAQPINIAGAKVGVAVCEDLWVEDVAVKSLRRAGADLVAHINASPYYAGKQQDRLELLRKRAAEFGCPILYVNLVGGQDELVFDGGSVAVGPDGEVLAQAAQFEEELLIIDIEPGQAAKNKPNKKKTAPRLDENSEIYQALVLGTRDYVRKNGFEDVLVGISGGVDSALVAAIAADALGSERVYGVAMPSRFSSSHSLEDARALAKNLGIKLWEIPIEQAHQVLLQMLDFYIEDSPQSNLAAENIQARIRGTLLMALSNIKDWLVLTTGNKSENSVGYSTLYGDTAGAFAVIKDLWKTDVYKLAKARNQRSKKGAIPERIITKPPSAELRPEQRDDQSLPPYEELDPILKALVEEDKTPYQLAAKGGDLEFIKGIAKMLDQAEYKRRQVPPGVRISSKAFGKDRRLPITNLYS